MLGAHRRGFDWKEIAEVLHMTRAVTRSTFWLEIKRTKSKKVEAQCDGTASQRERDPDTPKIERPGTSRDVAGPLTSCQNFPTSASSYGRSMLAAPEFTPLGRRFSTCSRHKERKPVPFSHAEGQRGSQIRHALVPRAVSFPFEEGYSRRFAPYQRRSDGF